VKLLLGRVGEGSELWLDGDFKAQVDRKIFQEDNGLRNLILRLNGNPYFTYVNLEKSERSQVAALADLLD
jgi:predicted ribonuclease YlaK